MRLKMQLLKINQKIIICSKIKLYTKHIHKKSEQFFVQIYSNTKDPYTKLYEK